MASRSFLLASVVLGAISNSVVPVSALLLMPKTDFGIFSIVYLIYALGWSVALSVVCDTWARTRRDEERMTYRWVSLQWALLPGLVSGVTACVLYADVWAGLSCGVGTLATLYRTASRFQETVLGGNIRSLVSDGATVLAFIVAVAMFRLVDVSWGSSIVSSWALSGVAGALLFCVRGRSAKYGLVSWIRDKRATIKPLLGESLLMDVGAGWAPLAMAPLMAAPTYALYRGVSSVATPVQFLLDPLRPALSLLSPRRTTRGWWLLAVTSAALLMASACWFILVLVVSPLAMGGETLIALAAFATPVSVYVLANFLGHFYYIAARSHASHGRLLRGRIFQTITIGVVPFFGLALGALGGAIWALAAATLCSSLVWLHLARLVARDENVADLKSPSILDSSPPTLGSTE